MKTRRWLRMLFVVSTGIITTAANEREEKRQVVIWVRAASESEMRLDTSAPGLRGLARRGVCFLDLGRFDRERLLDVVRGLGDELTTKIDEVQLSHSAPSDPLDHLLDQLGRPPPIGDEEKEALNRLRAAGRTTSGAITVDGDRTRSTRRSRPRARPNLAVEHVAGRVPESITRGTPLILVNDTLPERLTQDSPGSTDRFRDAVLERTSREVFSYVGGTSGSLPHRSLIVVLLPEDGNPALIVAGHHVKKGRVVRRDLDSSDIVDGIERLLKATRSRSEHGAWVEDALINDE